MSPVIRPDLDRALALLSSDERVRARGMGSVATGTRFVLARATLRLLLARMARGGTEPRDLRFRYGRRGKPYLPGGPSFNVSRVTARRFAPAEQEWIAATGDGTSADEAFFRTWTRKEAFAKAFGRGPAAGRVRVDGRTADAFSVLGLLSSFRRRVYVHVRSTLALVASFPATARPG